MLKVALIYALCIFILASTIANVSSANLLPLPLLKTVEVHEPALAKVGDLVEHVPTAVSHQSSTIVHSHAPRVSPILAPATAVRSYVAPHISTFAAAASAAAVGTPLVESRAYHALPLGPAAAFVHAHAPYIQPHALLRYSAPLLYATTQH